MYSNPAARLGYGSGNLVDQGDYVNLRLSNNYQLLLNLYRSSWIIRKVVDVMAEDMLKDWPKITSQISPALMDSFSKVVNKTATQTKVLEALKWGRLFGGGLAIMVIKGHKDLSVPLDLSAIELDSYKGLIALDRWTGVYPDFEVVDDIENIPEFGHPKYYECDIQANGVKLKVHHSRVLRFIGRDLPNWERQATMHWGLSEVELVFDELRKRDYASWNIVSLMTRAQIMTIRDGNLSGALSGLGMSNDALTQYITRLQAMSESMSNQGILALPEDGGLEAHSYSFGGLADVYNTFLLDVSGACETPMTKLYGRTVTGLGQTGEGDLQIYYDTVEQKRKRELRPQLDKLFPVIAMSTWGQVPDDLDYAFAPVRTLSDKDKADLAKSKSDAIIGAFNAGLIGRQTALKELRQCADDTGMFSNISDKAISEADDEVMSPMEMGMESLNFDRESSDKEDKQKKETPNKKAA